MNADETRALWELGRDAWNEWASEILKSKANFEEAGTLALNWFGEAENEETRLWLKVATADFSGIQVEDDADFSGFRFPGPAIFTQAVFARPASFREAVFELPARFSHATFHQDVSFAGAKFQGVALFEETAFEGAADFEHTEFLRETNGPLTAPVRFQRAHFAGRADFRSASFAGNLDFSKVKCAAVARFDEARLKAESSFEGTIFAGVVSFNKAQLTGAGRFVETQFSGDARFGEAVFKAPVSFDRAQFWANVSFRHSRLEQDASFVDMRVEGDARLKDAKFGGRTVLDDVRIKGETDLTEAEFAGALRCRLADFGGPVRVASARFSGDADFTGSRFGKGGDFQSTQFLGPATFREVRFEGPVSFAGARFPHTADFSAVQSRVAFVLADASFGTVPSFLEASFHEPPRVDHMTVTDPLRRFVRWSELGLSDPRPIGFRLMRVCADPDASAKYRRLKKLAFEAQDQTREQEFFAQELRCRRFWHDRPFGRGVARFWLAWFYGGVANFGRSMLRPFMLWLASILVFALYYLGQRDVGHPEQAAADTGPIHRSGITAWLDQFIGKLSGAVDGACLAANSSPLGEALYLSFRNALLMTGWEDEDTARRVFGCLYGMDGPYPIVPLSVSAVSLLQTVLSAGLIFMFLLALRNLLKVR